MTVRFKTLKELIPEAKIDKYTYQIDDVTVPRITIQAVAGKELQLRRQPLSTDVHVLVDNYTYQVFECLVIDEDRFKFNLFKKEINLRNNNV